jgi:hypothetical protein
MVPKGLRVWFVIHFALDVAFTVPLLVAPKSVLSLLGWTTIDPFAESLKQMPWPRSVLENRSPPVWCGPATVN